MFQALARLFTFSNFQRIISVISVATQAIDSVVGVVRVVAPVTKTKADDNFVQKYDESKAYVEKNIQNALAQAEKLRAWGMIKDDAGMIDKVIYLLQKSFQSKNPGEILSEEALKTIEAKVKQSIKPA